MTQENSLAAELEQAKARSRRRDLDPTARVKRSQLSAKAQTLALRVLKTRHEQEYAELYERAKKEVGLE